jgi:Ca2+-binding RTX toxin-like protein
VTGNDGADTIDGGAGANTLSGGADNDSLIGGTSNDTLNGGTGVDSMAGGLGNDLYYVDDPNDVVSENPAAGTDTVYLTAGSYTLAANAENLVLQAGAATGTGNSANNVIGTTSAAGVTMNGAGGNDTIAGGAGNDTVNGGAGADSLSGGTAGSDYFTFAQGEANGDIVAGFSHAADDRLYFTGFNTATATFTHTAGNTWTISDGVNPNESITLVGIGAGPLIAGDDYYFI